MMGIFWRLPLTYLVLTLKRAKDDLDQVKSLRVASFPRPLLRKAPGQGMGWSTSFQSQDSVNRETPPTVMQETQTQRTQTIVFSVKKITSKCHFDKQCDCSHGHYPHAKASKSSRSAGTLHHKLAKINEGLAGPNYSIRVNDTEPCQLKVPNPSQLNQHQQELVSEEITEIISKGAISELQTTPEPGNGFFSTLFLVQKKDGGQRPVINLKRLNSFVNAPHFKMEGIHTLKSLLKKGIGF
uniref:Reverse transcriptase domain-containing protein n=1 Tax=Amphimedon queenslandica TaxID=400682 RepID=A0A1X7U5V3_AMPQE